jgi:hypothetical protein
MPIARSLLIAALSLTILSCASDRPGAENLVMRGGPPPGVPGNAAPASEEREERVEPAAAGDVVAVPDAVVRELMAFVNRRHFLLADRIEVDASRIPFQAAMVPVADPSYVDSVELGNEDAKAVGLLIRSRSVVPMVERDFPRLRCGDGMDLVAVREIAVRTWNEVRNDRPVFITIRGVGHAVYRDEASGRQIRKDAISLVAEAVPGRGGLELRTSVN